MAWPIPRTFPKKPDPGKPLPDFRKEAGWDVLYLPKMIMIAFLRWFFQEAIEGFRWSRDPTRTDLDIVDKHTTYADNVHTKPRIVVDRGSLQWMNTSISKSQGSNSVAVPTFTGNGQFSGFSATIAAGGSPGTIFSGSSSSPGGEIVTDLYQGRLNVQCYAEEGLVAERMAALIFSAVRVHRPQLREMGFFSVDSEAVGTENLIFHTSNTRWIGVPVTIRYFMEFNAKTSQRTDIDQFECESDRPPKIVIGVVQDRRCAGEVEEPEEEG